MKINKIFRIVTLLVIIVLGFYSCSEDTRETEDTLELSAEDIGKYHNLAVDLFQKSRSSKRIANDTLTIIEIKNTITELMKKNYPELMDGYIEPSK